jgi:hypothetical protein
MEILVTPHNEQEQKVLLAFLDSLRYEYTSVELNFQGTAGTVCQTIEEYNNEIQEAEAEYSKGQSITTEELKKNMSKW